MKKLEEDILKRLLQDTFSDYEPMPNEQTWENIQREIQPHHPKNGASFKQWTVPIVALLLLISGILWNIKEHTNNPELAINSTKENTNSDLQIADYQKIITEKILNKNIANQHDKSERIYVNKPTSKVESMVIPKIEKSLELPTFSTILIKPFIEKNSHENSVNAKEFVSINDKSLSVASLNNSLKKDNDVNILTNKHVRNKPIVFSFDEVAQTDNGLGNMKHNSQSIAQIEESKEPNLENAINHISINDANIEEVRYIKPLETLKNKDFVFVKNEISIPKITSLLINKDPKPIIRPTYMSISLMPIQTYRIFTVNHLGVQNLQTHNLFDSERNGWAFELGIVKPMGNKWNFRGGISYLKMQQRAEYQVNTNNISVKNSTNYSNAAVVVGNGTEYIGQTRIEQKTLQMVGFKGDIQKFFKVSGRNRYFISGGSQLMYELNEKQTNVFMNASAGFQHVVNKDLFLTIEPTASYLLNNINDSKSLIQTNAYNLGLKVGVSFKVK